jgi:integrase
MAQIRRRVGKAGKVSYSVRVRIAGRKERTKSFKSLVKARIWAGDAEKGARDGEDFPDRKERKRTVSDLIARYRSTKLPSYSRREQAQRGRKLDWWEEQIGERRLLELDAGDLAECVERLAIQGPGGEAVGPATQTRYLATIKHVLAVAYREWGWLRVNPGPRVRAPREPRGRLRYLSTEEKNRLLAACKVSSDRRLYPLVVVALGTGARQGELLGLRWSSVDLDRRRAVLEDTKNGERRTLVLAGPVLDELRELARVRRIGTDLVFATRRGLASFPQRQWKDALDAAEICDFHFHDLRHTFASWLAMSGATLAELAEALGHKTLAMVKRYAHLTEQHVSRVVGRMTERFLVG